jgi:thiamine biosynthesis lipoprotein
MGTVVTIDVYADQGVGASAVEPLVRAACAVLHEVDEVFSTWKPDSPMSRVRRGELSLEEAPPEMAAVLALCAAARDLSGGWFDPWVLPGGVDPTGYVKGWAARRALDALASPLLTGAIVNAGGDIAMVGDLGPLGPFRFGIIDPAAPRELVCVVEPTGALATSGTYERGAHLFDPHAGRPAARVASASVTGADLGLADALATAVAVAGEAGLELVDPLDGYEAMTVAHDGTMRWTTGFPMTAMAAGRAPEDRQVHQGPDGATGAALGRQP